MRNALILFVFCFSSYSGFSQAKLQSGPMVGYSSMREVALWVQTTSAADVRFRYSEVGKENWRWTRPAKTKSSSAFTATLIADTLEPGKKYRYELFIEREKVEISWKLEFQTQDLWQWRHDPPAFTMALGSCFFVNDSLYDRPGKPYGGDYQILNSIYARDPDVMVWLGDNVYLREADLDSRTGIYSRYTQTRSYPGLQPLLGSIHHYATWDDHDYGPNDSDRGFYLKKFSRDAFMDFWANPVFGLQGEGITSVFHWADADVFLLDDRWWRANDQRSTGERTMIGEKQYEWLLDNLKFSQAPFKLICNGSQVLNPAKNYETWSNHFPAERDSLLSAIAREKISGVVFLTGDRHHTELSQLKTESSHVIHDLTVSPLTSASHANTNEPNTLLVPGTFVGERNFAILEFSGPRTSREMKIVIYDSNGKELWNRVIRP